MTGWTVIAQRDMPRADRPTEWEPLPGARWSVAEVTSRPDLYERKDEQRGLTTILLSARLRVTA